MCQLFLFVLIEVQLVSVNGYLSESLTGLLEAVTHRADREHVIAIEEQTVQVVVFRLAETCYGFYGECIKEILPVGEISYIPGVPDYLLGVTNVRGELESVLDLRRALSLPGEQITKRSRIMLGEAGELRSGLLVDAVEDVLEMPEEQIFQPEPIREATWKDYLIGESTYNGHDLFILDLGHIFEHLLHYS